MHGHNYYFESRAKVTHPSIARICPVLMEIFEPKSVIDVGCGVGAWLAHLCSLGVVEVRGLDSAAALESGLSIAENDFEPCDLTDPPEQVKRSDLAISLEVAEHLPGDHADHFVDFLIRQSDVVLFSAAIPGQGGTHHINEQWQEYWAEYFFERGYRCFDLLRPRFWSDPEVRYWYVQNGLCFVKDEAVASYPKLASEREIASCQKGVLSVVHPELLGKYKGRRDRPGVLDASRLLIQAVKRKSKDAISRSSGR